MKNYFSLKNLQWQSIWSDIQSYLSNTIGGRSRLGQNSVFGQLLTVVASIGHNIILYIEDSFSEQNKYSCSRKKSIFGLASQSGYTPSLGKSAGVWLRISPMPHNGNGLDLIVTNHTKLMCTQNGLYYSLILDTAATTLKCSGDLSNKYFYAAQGSYESQRFVTNGGKLQVINLSYNNFIDTDYIEVRVNGNLWEHCASLYDMTPNGEQYYLSYNPTGGLDICFGNERYGKIVTNEDIIDVAYLVHDGLTGNIDVNDDTYFTFVSNLKDIEGNEVDGNSAFDIKMFTTDSVASGSDAESADQVARMIGYNSRSLVLADSNAYKAELNKYSFVGYNKTWSEPGNLVVKSVVMRNYKALINEGIDYFSLSKDDFYLNDTQKTSIINALEKSGAQLAGTSYNILDMILKQYALFVYVKLKNSDDDQSLIETQIKNVVGSFFAEIDNDDYIPKSDIANIIKEEVEEVDGINIYILGKDNEEALINGYYYDKKYVYDNSNGTFKVVSTKIPVFAGENPNLGFDAHGNILIENEDEYPVLLGGWQWKNSNNDLITAQPITIIFE